jgi:hypothetical protein
MARLNPDLAQVAQISRELSILPAFQAGSR